MSEEAGWKLWNEHKSEIDYVVVNPLLVFGPPLTSQLNASQGNLFVKMLTGEMKTIQPGSFGVTDVRDVAEAHILALENPKAVGRRQDFNSLIFPTILFRLFSYSGNSSWKALAREMKRQFPEYPITVVEDDESANWTMDTKLFAEMGKKDWISFEQMVKDTVEGLIKVGAVPDLRKQ